MITTPQLLMMDAYPFPTIRTMITEQLKRSLDTIDTVTYGQETREVPSNSAWKRHEPTGERYCNVEFTDGKTYHFAWWNDGPVEVTPV